MDVALTTKDNPYDPFDEFDLWYAFDLTHGYRTLDLLARVVRTSDELSDADQARAAEDGMDEIVFNDVEDLFVKVKKPDRVPEIVA